MARVAYELSDASAKLHRVILLRPGKRTSFSLPYTGKLGLMELSALGHDVILLPDLRRPTWRTLLNWLSEFTPDIIHAQDFGPTSMLVQDWALEHHIPFVLTLHCLPSRTPAFGSLERLSVYNWIAASRMYLAFVMRFIKRCDGVIALNQAMSDDLLRLGYHGPIYRVPNGRNLAEYNVLPLADSTQPTKQLIFIGSFARRKNQHFIIDMLAHLRTPLDLSFFGEALEPGYLHSLQAVVRERGLDGIVQMGHIPYNEIPAHLAQAHLFVSASTLEVQSLAVIEALASGTPVVGLANETLDELVDDTCGHRLNATDSPADLAHEVDKILSLPPGEYQALCMGARARVQHLDWSAVVSQTAAVYQELADRKHLEPISSRSNRPVWTPLLVAGSRIIWTGYSLLHPNRKTKMTDNQ
ncbi:MAG: glycosyltransferase [Anaerolineae bacterium]